MYARLIVKRVVYKITHSLLLLLTLQEKWTEYSIENIKIAVNFRGDSIDNLLICYYPLDFNPCAWKSMHHLRKNWEEILWSPFMKDKDDLALEAVFVCTAEPAAADWLPPASLTLRLKRFLCRCTPPTTADSATAQCYGCQLGHALYAPANSEDHHHGLLSSSHQ